MRSQLRHRVGNEEGFTLVELLVVILIVGLLAAIAIPNFLGQRQKANDAAAKSNARNAVSAMESCFTDAQSYAGCDNSTLQAGGLTVTTASDAGAVKANNSGGVGGLTSYSVTAYSRSGNSFKVEYDGTITTGSAYKYTCTRTAAPTGGCPASGFWSS